MEDSRSNDVAFYITVGDWTWTSSIPANTSIKTERGTLRADELTSGEYGEMWGKPANESEYRWLSVQRAYFLSIKVG